jgi:hypothetical protein
MTEPFKQEAVIICYYCPNHMKINHVILKDHKEICERCYLEDKVETETTTFMRIRDKK